MLKEYATLLPFGVYLLSLPCSVVLGVFSNLAIILMRTRELVAILVLYW